MIRYLEALPLPALPADPATRRVWTALSRQALGSESLRMLQKKEGLWCINHGPHSTDQVVARAFLHQSIFYKALSKQTPEAIEKMGLNHVSAALMLSADPMIKWADVINLITGDANIGRFGRTAVKCYAMCIATGDPYKLQSGLERLVAEMYALPPHKAKARLLRRVKTFANCMPPRTLERYAVEAGIKGLEK